MKFLASIVLVLFLAAVAMAFPGPEARADATRDWWGGGGYGGGGYGGGGYGGGGYGGARGYAGGNFGGYGGGWGWSR